MNQSSTRSRLITGYFEVKRFETSLGGSVRTADILLRQRYSRPYFDYAPDSVHRTIVFRRMPPDSMPAFTPHYAPPDQPRGADTVLIALRRQRRHFQLTEWPLHWPSEANRYG